MLNVNFFQLVSTRSQKTSVSLLVLPLSASSPRIYSYFLLSCSTCCKYSFMGVNYTCFTVIQFVYIPPWDLSALALRGFNLGWNSQQKEHNTLWKPLPTRRVSTQITRNLGQRYHEQPDLSNLQTNPVELPRSPVKLQILLATINKQHQQDLVLLVDFKIELWLNLWRSSLVARQVLMEICPSIHGSPSEALVKDGFRNRQSLN